MANLSYLKYVSEIPEVEDVVELGGGGQEGEGDLLMQLESRLHQWLRHL